MRTATPALLAASLLAAACGEGGPPAGPAAGAPPAPVEVSLVRVGTGSVPRSVRATGTFFPEEEVTVSAKVAGRVASVGPEAGDRVAPESVLLRIDDTDYRLLRDQRAAALAESLARLGLDGMPAGEVDHEALPSVEKARLEEANAAAKLERARTLRDRDPPLISAQDFADLETLRDVAGSALRAARLDARTALALARTRAADLAAVEQQVRDAVHAAPPGTEPWLVAQRLVSAGDYVAVGRPLYRLLDASPLRLRVRVPEARMEGVVPGKAATATVAGSAKPVSGRVTRLRPEVDPATRTFEVEIEVGNPDLAIAAGAFAVAEIAVGLDEGVPLVPASSVVVFAGVRKVFVDAGGRAEERRVVLGRRAGDSFEVLGGLAPGDEVLASPPGDLVPGAPLRVVPAPPAPPAAPAAPGKGGR
ncbi:MAG: efflux RND transporter periplasmic adaptor subunit [Planctomycetes bacterium]|nr:efflux RND transporter periplasmic adaptor subunit [Planctomycetota bacterium]